MPRPSLRVLTGVIGLLLAGCTTTPPVHESARSTFEAFVEQVEKGDYSAAYRYLSEDTRNRYKLHEVHGLLKKTRAGRLLRWKIEHWTIRDVRTTGDGRAYIVLGSPEGDRTDRYELIREATGEGKRAWRLRYYIADEMNIPRSDEEMLFSNREEG